MNIWWDAGGSSPRLQISRKPPDQRDRADSAAVGQLARQTRCVESVNQLAGFAGEHGGEQVVHRSRRREEVGSAVAGRRAPVVVHGGLRARSGTDGC